MGNLFWESRSNEVQRLEEELMTTRLKEMEAITELKELRLKVQILFFIMYSMYFILYCMLGHQLKGWLNFQQK